MAHSMETTNGETNQVEHEGGHVQQEQEDGMLFAMTMLSSMMVPLAIRSAVELGIFDIIGKAGEGVKLSAEDIALQIGTKNPEAPIMLDRLLRLLASHSLLSCSLVEEQDQQHQPKRLYGLTSASKYFAIDANGVSFGALLDLALDKVFLESWTELKGSIIEGGIAFNRVHGMHAFGYSQVNPRFNHVFNKAMFNFTTIVMNKVLEFYQGFEHINRLVDVGGGLGINLKLITSKYPHVHGVNFDLPHVVEHAPTFPGVEHVGGDMFESVPNGNAIFMKGILHDWSDEHCLKLLKNCHKAIPNDGKVIVVELIVPILPEGTFAAKTSFQVDLLMMTQHVGGKERTKNEFMELALRSGFSGITFVCCVSGYWVMEFFK